MYRIEIPIDAGDGLNHYFIAEIAPRFPTYYLDHWGKPFFTLLSSAFAFLGFKGMIFFNIIIYTITCLIAFEIFYILRVRKILITLFPVFILFSYDSFYTITAGLTEPLFACMSICAAYFLLQKKYVYFALFVSILPFCRSEGQLVILIAILILIFQKQFKIIPLIFFSHVVYGIIGWFVFDDLFWYFNNNPYPKDSIYGNGNWYHFITNSYAYLGYIGLPFSTFALLIGLEQFFQKKIKAEHFTFLFFGFSIFFGILLFHSYFWATGTNGSLGLTRVMIQGSPLFFIIMIFFVSNFFEEKLKVSKRLFVEFHFYMKLSIFFIIGIFLFQHVKRITKEEVQEQYFEKEVLKAAHYLKKNAPNTSKIFYHHPLIALGVGINMFEKNDTYIHAYFNDTSFYFNETNHLDLIVRDSQFGPVEMGLDLNKLHTFKHLNLVQNFTPYYEGNHYHGEAWKVDVFQYNINQKVEVKEMYIPFLKARKFKMEKESIIIFDTIFKSGNGNKIKLKIKSSIYPIHLILDQERPDDYRGHILEKNRNQEYILNVIQNRKIKLYLWNPQNKKGNISLDTLFISKIQYPPLEK